MGLGYVVPSLIVTDFNLNATHCDNCINDVTNQSSGDTSTFKSQLLILVSISTGMSILNLVGMVIIYDRDPEQAANNAERKRSTIFTELIRSSIMTQLSIDRDVTPVKSNFLSQRRASQQSMIKIIKLKNYVKSVKNILTNKNCRYMVISQRKNSPIWYGPYYMSYISNIIWYLNILIVNFQKFIHWNILCNRGNPASHPSR